MSLFLRQACQPFLDGVGLPNYHIQVSEATKCLQVVGECGDILTSITGIRLSRMAPADKEIALAISLFDDFLAKHAETFKGFIAAKIRADKAIVPMETPNLLDSKVKKHTYQDFWHLHFNLASRPEVEISVKSSGLVSIPAMTFETVSDKDIEIQQRLNPLEKAAVFEWICACTEYHEAVTLKTKLLSKLSTCEI